MCGFAGYIHFNGSTIEHTGTMREMLQVQKHRGPDDSGIRAFSLATAESVAYDYRTTTTINKNFEGIIGFNRLSILDLSANGHQPMLSPNEQVMLLMNGEIYNAFDFKPQLEQEGVHFKSTCDTEVVLHLYLKYGFEKMIGMLNGMFAIAVVDLTLKTIFVARDRFGIKPIYYHYENGCFAFASELKSLYALPHFKATLNESLLSEYLIFRNTINKTLLQGVEGIEPGHFLIISSEGKITQQQYFNINQYQRKNDVSISETTAMESLHDVLKESVRSQLMSDVKLGCQLSGGVDSSVVTALAKEIQQNNLLESVSIVFDDPRFSEKTFIEKVAAQLHIIAHQFLLDSSYYRNSLEKATWHFEGPVNHPNTLGIYLLAQQARKYVTVLLSGEGADEVFGGYTRFYDMVFPYTNKKFFVDLKNHKWNAGKFLLNYMNPVHRAVMANGFMHEQMAKKLFPDFNIAHAVDHRKAIYESLSGSVFDKQMKYEMTTYLPDLLIRQDKMSMAHSIENRVPFLDNHVVEQSFTIPEKYLVKRKAPESNNTEKYLLKKLCAQTFGNEFAFRDKMGFGIPLRAFMGEKTFQTYLHEQIVPGIKKHGLLDATPVTYWINNLQRISSAEVDALWVATSLEIWMQQMIDHENSHTTFSQQLQ